MSKLALIIAVGLQPVLSLCAGLPDDRGFQPTTVTQPAPAGQQRPVDDAQASDPYEPGIVRCLKPIDIKCKAGEVLNTKTVNGCTIRSCDKPTCTAVVRWCKDGSEATPSEDGCSGVCEEDTPPVGTKTCSTDYPCPKLAPGCRFVGLSTYDAKGCKTSCGQIVCEKPEYGTSGVAPAI